MAHDFTLRKLAGIVSLMGLAGVAIAASPAPVVPDAELKVKYKISFIGFDLARANLVSKFDHGLYATRVGYRTTGIVKAVAINAVGDLAANGALDVTHLIPASFTQASKENSKESIVNMAIAGGAIKSVNALPEPSPDPARVPVKDENKKNVLDPVSAMIVPIGKSKDGLSGACNRSIPIFDGWTRFDVNLTFKSAQTVDRAGYKGDSVTCAIRWVPIAGHIPDRKGTKFMAENKDIEVTLAPIGDTGMAAPLHIGVQTMRGHVDIDALEFTVSKSTPSPAPQPAAPAAPATPNAAN